VPDIKDKIDLKDIDFDADLAIPGQYVIRSKQAAFNVVSKSVATPRDALVVLADLVLALGEAHDASEDLERAGIGAKVYETEWNAPAEGVEASKLEADDCAIWFVGVPLDRGMLTLAKVLKRPDVLSLSRSRGVTPMLTS
jgi:hypothetical protein